MLEWVKFGHHFPGSLVRSTLAYRKLRERERSTGTNKLTRFGPLQAALWHRPFFTSYITTVIPARTHSSHRYPVLVFNFKFSFIVFLLVPSFFLVWCRLLLVFSFLCCDISCAIFVLSSFLFWTAAGSFLIRLLSCSVDGFFRLLFRCFGSSPVSLHLDSVITFVFVLRERERRAVSVSLAQSLKLVNFFSLLCQLETLFWSELCAFCCLSSIKCNLGFLGVFWFSVSPQETWNHSYNFNLVLPSRAVAFFILQLLYF